MMLVSAGGLIGACAALAGAGNLAEAPRTFLLWFSVAFGCYALGLAVWTRQEGRRAIIGILAVGAACRLVLLPAAPSLSTDAYRYVWDARVASAGIDPYAYPPVAPELAALRDPDIFPRLNHPTWRAIYPPGAQAFFRLVYWLAPDSVMAMKLVLGLAEAAAVGLVLALLATLGLPPARVVIYAWNPLVLVEVWGSAHLDALVLPLVIAATLAAVRGVRDVAAVLVGLATLVKIYPVVFLPLLLDRRRLRVLGLFALTVGLGYLPAVLLGHRALGSLPRYLSEETFNPGLIRSFVDGAPWTIIGIIACIVWAATREAGISERAVGLIGGVVILGPNVFPWYGLWLVPFLAVTPSAPWIAFTGTVAFSYAFFLYQPWTLPIWARVVEILPLAAGAVARLTARGAAAGKVDIAVTSPGGWVLGFLRRRPGSPTREE